MPPIARTKHHLCCIPPENSYPLSNHEKCHTKYGKSASFKKVGKWEDYFLKSKNHKR